MISSQNKDKQLDKFYKDQKKKDRDRINKIQQRQNYRASILKDYKRKIRDLEDKSQDEYINHIKNIKLRHTSLTKDVYHTQRKNRDDKHFYTQDLDFLDDDEVRSSLDKLASRMDSAEKRKSEIKEKISKTAQEFSSRVPLIRNRYQQNQERQIENQQIEFVKLHRKNNNSYKRHEKYITELKYRK